MTKNKLFFILSVISILISLIYPLMFLYFNYEPSIIYVINILINIVMLGLFFKIALNKKYVLVSLFLILISVSLIIKNNNSIEHLDVYAPIVSKTKNKNNYFIQIKNYGELSNKNISLKINKSEYDNIMINKQKHLITYRNYNLNEDINFSKLEKITIDNPR